MKALVTIVALALAALDVSVAQSAADSSAAPGCERRAGAAASYARCSLWLEDDYLYAGRSGEPVAHGEGLNPLPLSRFVVGDSARHYALRYERDKRRAGWLELVAGAMMIEASVALVTQRRCTGTSYFNQHPCPAKERMLYGGLAVDLASFLVSSRAEGEGSWALAWHNRALTH